MSRVKSPYTLPKENQYIGEPSPAYDWGAYPITDILGLTGVSTSGYLQVVKHPMLPQSKYLVVDSEGKFASYDTAEEALTAAKKFSDETGKVQYVLKPTHRVSPARDVTVEQLD
jgi:hypothetical protein